MPLSPAHRSQKARLLLGLWLCMLLNGVVFRHAHRLPTGQIISHAHPYIPKGKTPFQPHQHTRQELIWLDIWGQPLTDIPVALLALLAPAIGWFTTSCGWHRPLLLVRCAIRANGRRGPPAGPLF